MNSPRSYQFQVQLLNNAPLAIWQTGRLTCTINDDQSVSGQLLLPGQYAEPIPFTGQKLLGAGAGTLLDVSGDSSQAQFYLTFVLQEDGGLYMYTYLGGIIYLLDKGGEETYPYVVNGYAPLTSSEGQ